MWTTWTHLVGASQMVGASPQPQYQGIKEQLQYYTADIAKTLRAVGFETLEAATVLSKITV